LSLGLISTIVAVFIGLVAGSESIFLVALGTFLGSALLSILGLILASRINSLNQFILITVPIECIILVPAIFNMFGFEHKYLRFHPGVIILHLISSVTENPILSIFVLIIWIVFFYFLAHKSIFKMMKSLGGVKF
jgi:fluoroquinolone transport system permease protein